MSDLIEEEFKFDEEYRRLLDEESEPSTPDGVGPSSHEGGENKVRLGSLIREECNSVIKGEEFISQRFQGDSNSTVIIKKESRVKDENIWEEFDLDSLPSIWIKEKYKEDPVSTSHQDDTCLHNLGTSPKNEVNSGYISSVVRASTKEEIGCSGPNSPELSLHSILQDSSARPPLSCALKNPDMMQSEEIRFSKPFARNHYDRKFISKGTLKKHFLHTGEKSFTCHHCDKKFSTKGNLRKHLLVNTGEKSFTCHHCFKKLSGNDALKYHLLIHSGEKPFTCQHCDEKCRSKGALKLHLLIHSGAKPFACHHCDKKFLRQAALDYHLFSHKGERPFACHDCNKKCISKEALIMHSVIHNAEKPFACQHCDKKFLRKAALEFHSFSHTGERSFTCHNFDKIQD